MAKKQLLWGPPKGVQERIPQKETPTQGSEGVVWGYFPAGLSPIVQSKSRFVKKKAPDCSVFIFIVDL